MAVRSRHNKLILELISDTRYIVKRDGTITRARDGKRLGYAKGGEASKRGKAYLYVRYKGKEIKVHRIIYAKFGGELLRGYVIHHRDANGLNPAFDNLEQVTQSANNYYRYQEAPEYG
jgi:hypothetical protein